MNFKSYPPPRTIAIDVDGTLIINGRPNNKLIQWIKTKKESGYKTILWSMRGEEYAQSIAEQLEILNLFDHITSKPGYLVDDMGWKWIDRTKVLNPNKEEQEE